MQPSHTAHASSVTWAWYQYQHLFPNVHTVQAPTMALNATHNRTLWSKCQVVCWEQLTTAVHTVMKYLQWQTKKKSYWDFPNDMIVANIGKERDATFNLAPVSTKVSLYKICCYRMNFQDDITYLLYVCETKSRRDKETKRQTEIKEEKDRWQCTLLYYPDKQK